MPSGPLAGERVSFTGTLASMTHREAQALVEQHGGIATTHVSRQTTLLVVGEEGWPLEEDGTPSVKLQQVQHWQEEGLPVRIINETDWLSVLGLDAQRQEVHRHYTPAMLSQMLDLPVGTIRSWERAGLIKAVRRIYRLPYFDYQEVAGARRLAELLDAGVPRRQIEASLEKLREMLGGNDRAWGQIEVLARDRKVVYRDNSGLIESLTGQRLFEFEGEPAAEDVPETLPLAPGSRNVQTHWTADDWYEEACRLIDEHELAAAVDALRLCLMDQPGRAEAHFQLAETLYRMDNVQGALERYHMTVELDPKYLEAWTQLGCVYSQLGQPQAALDAFDVALDVHPEYPDAHLHKAELLHQLGRSEEARLHWETYLQFDQRGPWAENARQRLEELEDLG